MAEQASTSVKHMALPCHWSQRTTVTGDLVRCYGALGRTIIFCDTKRDCNELTAALGEDMRARALHGDIPQQQREVRPPLPSVSLPPPQPGCLIWSVAALCCTITGLYSRARFWATAPAKRHAGRSRAYNAHSGAYSKLLVPCQYYQQLSLLCMSLGRSSSLQCETYDIECVWLPERQFRPLHCAALLGYSAC